MQNTTDLFSSQWLRNMSFIDTIDALLSRQEVLLRTRELLSNGWCKGRYHLTSLEQASGRWVGICPDPDKINEDRFCLIGAIHQAAMDVGYVGNVSDIAAIVQQVIGEEGPISRWNDQPHRTKEEVLATVDRAICLVTCDS